MTQIDQLQRQIEAITIENSYKRNFVPEDDLSEAVTRDEVKKVLKTLSPDYLVDRTTTYVVERAIKIFTILVVINQVQYLKRFIENDQFARSCLDDLLPFPQATLKALFSDDHVERLFYKRQWEFTAPVFSGDLIHRSLDDRTVLPYIHDKHIAQGGFGSIYQIDIQPWYHPKAFPHVTRFVRKELEPGDNTFENEARILAILQRLKHPNILPLVGCYTYQEKHNLVSPFIAGGNLRQLLRGERPAELSLEDALLALAGLASALWALHEFVQDDSEPSLKGNHQDLRPDNILVDNGRFLLADFGLSSIKNLSATSRTPFKGKQGYCQAPECTDLITHQDHEVTRAIDIFSFACVIADVLVFVAEGHEGVEKFRQSREFTHAPMCYSLFHKGKTANPAVGKKLHEIASRSKRQSSQETVLLVQRMLNLLPTGRPSAAEATAKLCRCTILAFAEQIKELFDKLPTSTEKLIQQSRFESWLVCQDDNAYNADGATNTCRMLESLVATLRRIILNLESLINNRQGEDGRDFLEIRSLLTELLNTLSPERRSRSQAHLSSTLLAAMNPNATDELSASLRASLGQCKTVQMVEAKELVEQHEQLQTPATRSQSKVLQVSSTDYSKKKVGQLVLANLGPPSASKKPTMLVETVQYTDVITGERLLERLGALHVDLSAKGLSRQLQLPPFYGLCHHSKDYTYDLLYNMPNQDASDSQRVTPHTLRQLINDSKLKPSLEERYTLAHNIAKALADFHSVTWFHKDLTSENVVFFQPEEAQTSVLLQAPYLLGLQHSRQATDDFTTGPIHDKHHDRYHHPSYVSAEPGRYNRFDQRFDWYSLGILLVEVGCWRPVTELMAQNANDKHLAFAKALIKNVIPNLAFTMGTAYADAVKFCLTAYDRVKDSSKSHAEDLRKAPNLVFKDQVIAPLSSLSAFHKPAELNSRKRPAGHDTQLHSRQRKRLS